MAPHTVAVGCRRSEAPRFAEPQRPVFSRGRQDVRPLLGEVGSELRAQIGAERFRDSERVQDQVRVDRDSAGAGD